MFSFPARSKAPGAVRALVVLAVLGIGWLSGAAVEAQPDLREMYVSVVDRDGVPVAGLNEDFFIVRENGVRREVLRVVPATAPMQIAVLVDNSAAATDHVRDLRVALEGFADKMAGDNEIALVTFGERPTIVTDYTRNRETLQDGIQRLFARAGTGAHLLDALVETARGIERRQAPRPVILAITTEGPEFSTIDYRTVVDRVVESGAAVHIVVLATRGRAAALPTDPERNRDLVIDQATARTGGRRDTLLTSQALPGRLQDVARELTSQYLVVYARPPALIPPDTIEVSAARPELTARGTPVRRRN